jgi:hypothetical protein
VGDLGASIDAVAQGGHHALVVSIYPWFVTLPGVLATELLLEVIKAKHPDADHSKGVVFDLGGSLCGQFLLLRTPVDAPTTAMHHDIPGSRPGVISRGCIV